MCRVAPDGERLLPAGHAGWQTQGARCEGHSSEQQQSRLLSDSGAGAPFHERFGCVHLGGLFTQWVQQDLVGLLCSVSQAVLIAEGMAPSNSGDDLQPFGVRGIVRGIRQGSMLGMCVMVEAVLTHQPAALWGGGQDREGG